MMVRMDMTPVASTPAAQPEAPGRIWKFWGTLLWGLAIYAAFNAAQFIALAGVVAWRGPLADDADLQKVAFHGVALSIMTVSTVPAVLAVIWLAVRRAGTPFADYLALHGFRIADLWVGLALIALYLPAVDALAHLSGRPVTPQVVIYSYTSARDAGALILLLLAVSLAAPIGEEFTVRGFLFRGWAATRLGPGGAIVLTAMLWAAMHLQYDWFFMGEIFGVGLVFGYMRWRSGSTWMTVALHGIYNFAAIVQAAVLDRIG